MDDSTLSDVNQERNEDDEITMLMEGSTSIPDFLSFTNSELTRIMKRYGLSVTSKDKKKKIIKIVTLWNKIKKKK